MVILKASYIVKAAEQTARRVMSLSEFDQVAAITHSPLLFFYRANKGYNFESSCHILKDSLSKALATFYPLAGRLNSISGDRFELDCNSMGARLLIAESKAKIEDYGDFRPSSPKLLSLLPSVDYTKPIPELPLLMLQLTKLAENGICLGFAISHIMADATSVFHFINELARIVRENDEISGTNCTNGTNLPFFNRTLLKAMEPVTPPSFEHPEYSDPPLLVGRMDAEQERREQTRIAMLKLSREEIDKIVKKANYGRIGSENDNNDRPYTKFEAISGHVWRCVSKSRKLYKNDQQLTRLYFPVDVRRRVEPKLPQGYFGNAVCRVAAGSTAKELVSYPLSYASSKIRGAISAVSDEYVRSSLRYLKCHKQISDHRTSHAPGSVRGVFHGNPNMVINTLVNVPIREADFGWGKLIHMGPAALGSDGKSVIMPSFDEDGAFTVLLRLQDAHIEDFDKFFYKDI